ncbi:MAG: TM2 domain-containing protein [Desulfovibrio sp.]|nr:TM2 domain-containing protein [Desulfovibrio sp.]
MTIKDSDGTYHYVPDNPENTVTKMFGGSSLTYLKSTVQTTETSFSEHALNFLDASGTVMAWGLFILVIGVIGWALLFNDSKWKKKTKEAEDRSLKNDFLADKIADRTAREFSIPSDNSKQYDAPMNCESPLNKEEPAMKSNSVPEGIKGSGMEIENRTVTMKESTSSRGVAFVLCLFLGFLGFHRFYVGKIGTGLLWFLTGGLFFIGVIVDLIVIAFRGFTDDRGALLV